MLLLQDLKAGIRKVRFSLMRINKELRRFQIPVEHLLPINILFLMNMLKSVNCPTDKVFYLV